MTFPEITSRKWWSDTIKIIRSLHDIQTVTRRGKKGRAIYSDRNVVIELPDTEAEATGSGSQLFQLMSEDDDFNVCRTCSVAEDGTRTLGAEDVYVAKPPELRHTITAEVINGDSITYTYTNEHERQAVKDAGEETEFAETQVVTPWYLPPGGGNDGSLIMATEVAATGVWRSGAELTWLEDHGREWALKYS